MRSFNLCITGWVIGLSFTCCDPVLNEIVSQFFKYEGRTSVQVYVAEHSSQTEQPI